MDFEKVKELFSHNAINKAWFAQNMYPALKPNAANAKFVQKLSGFQGRNFNEVEQNQIRDLLIVHSNIVRAALEQNQNSQ